MNVFKGIMIATITAFSFMFAGCDEVEELLGIEEDQWNHLVNEKEYETILEGNTLKYGTHEYSVEGVIDKEIMAGRFDDPTAYVSFSNIPSGYKEFSAVYNGLLGKSAHGVAAMIPMAMEIYARDNATGERCLRLLCHGETSANEVISVLKERFKTNEYGGENDSYVQRYIPAALLRGATPQNAYRPEEPYSVDMCASVNSPKESSLGVVHYIYILCKGWSTGGFVYAQRQVEILKPTGSGVYKVFSCPSTYVQCQQIVGTWRGLK